MAGAWLHTHPRQARSAYLSKVAARMYLPFGENFTKDTGGLSSSAWSTGVAATGLPRHYPAGSPPHVPTLPPPTTRASARAAPPRDPRTGELREPRPCGQLASGGWVFSTLGPCPLRAQRRPQGAISQGGSPTPSYPEDAAAPLNRGGRSPKGYSGSVQVLPGNHLVISHPRPRS